MTKPHQTAAYRAWRKKVLATCEPVCIRCGYPVDMTLPGNHPDGPSADHEPPVSLTGDIAPDLDGSGIAHLNCNRSHGGRLGAQRTNQSNTRSTSKPFLDRPQPTPAAPLAFTPEGSGKATGSPVEPRFHQDGFVMPRLETARPGAVVGSYGEAARSWLREVYGLELRGWQAYALERALEHDEHGVLAWPLVVLSVGRQSGKSVLSRAVCMWRLHHAELFGEPQTILHVANTVSTALEVMRPAGLWAVERYGKKAARWGNTAPQVELPSGDRWLVRAANDSAGVGYSISMAFMDEAWRIEDRVWEDAISPTLSERNSPQGWMVSTAGDSTSTLMQKYRQRAIDRLESDDPGSVLLLEWSAPPEADPDDPITWRWASPEWSDRREKFLRQTWENVETSAFQREFLNQWVIAAGHWLKDRWWDDTLAPDVDLPVDAQWSVALESDFDGMGHAVAIAAPHPDGYTVVRVTTHRTIKDADDRLAEIRAEHPNLYVQVTPGYAERLTQRFDTLVGQREAAAATQTLLDVFDRKAIRHDGNRVLREHFANSTISKRQAGWVLTAPMGRGGVYAARAVMFAVQQAAKAPRPVASIYVRHRA